jgi:hypothetical protein
VNYFVIEITNARGDKAAFPLQLEYQLTVHVPVKMIFAAFASDTNTDGITQINSPVYKITAEARDPVSVMLTEFKTVDSQGLTLIPGSETLGNNQFKLNLVGTPVGKPFVRISITPDVPLNAPFGTLDAGSYNDGDINPPRFDGRFRLEGEYQGNLERKQPEYAAVFKFELVTTEP